METSDLLLVCSEWLAVRFILLFTQSLIKAPFFSVNKYNTTLKTQPLATRQQEQLLTLSVTF